MLLRSRNRNRRHARRGGDVDVRLRPRRRGPVHIITGLIGLAAGTTLGVFVLWQGFNRLLEAFVFRNRAFNLARIEIHTDGRFRTDQVRAWAGVQVADNLMALDLPRVRRDLKLVPWIREASIEAVQPDGLRIRVWEREPVAQAAVWRVEPRTGETWAETFLIDAEGVVLSPPDPAWLAEGAHADFHHLPRLTGVSPDAFRPGAHLADRPIQLALRLLDAFEDSSMYVLTDLETVELAGPGSLRGRTRQGAEIVFGEDQFARQLRRWRRIHDFGLATGRSLAWLDLSVTNNVPARWQDTAGPAPAPRAKPLRTRPKHA